MSSTPKRGEAVVKSLAVAWELAGNPKMSDAAAAAVLAELSLYPEAEVLKAIDRCRREVPGRLSLAHIIQRIDDGRPTADEAWAQVGTDDENVTIVTTDEAMQARGEVSLLIEQGDMIAARVAFKDAYLRITTEARARGAQVHRTASLGLDGPGQERALAAAVQAGKLSAEWAADRIGTTPAQLLGQAPRPLALRGEAERRETEPQPIGGILTGRAMGEGQRLPGKIADLLRLVAEGRRPDPCGDGCDGYQHGDDPCPRWA